MLPDSPRYLASVGRKDEARESLTRIRGNKTASEELEHEYLEIITATQDKKQSSPIQFAKILVGKGVRPGSSLSRRAWLCLFLQIMASWTGITVSLKRLAVKSMLAKTIPGNNSLFTHSPQPGWVQ